MDRALRTLADKGVFIFEEEAKAVTIAILLHDIGHGPFSHALENILVEGINHEEISLMLMEALNDEFGNEFSLAIQIFNGTYPKKYLHQLVSGQLDMDRLDYLSRDSFFSGVHEGTVGYDRIIKMINVHKGRLVVEEKGIYSIEKFLMARRLMYWQVYLHKTVLVAEIFLQKIILRAKQLVREGVELSASPPLKYFLHNAYNSGSSKQEFIANYVALDDYDLHTAFKEWQLHDDFILSNLCKRVIDRRLFKVHLEKKPFDEKVVEGIEKKLLKKYPIKSEDLHYFVFKGEVSNTAYSSKSAIDIYYKNGQILDIAKASDHLNIKQLASPVVKHYLCYPKEIN